MNILDLLLEDIKYHYDLMVKYAITKNYALAKVHCRNTLEKYQAYCEASMELSHAIPEVDSKEWEGRTSELIDAYANHGMQRLYQLGLRELEFIRKVEYGKGKSTSTQVGTETGDSN